MFGYYLKKALRHIRSQKGFSLVNIGGLAIGIACCILILLWVSDELSYDRFHEKIDDIYAVYFEQQATRGTRSFHDSSPYPLAAVLKEECSEVKAAARISTHERILITFGEKSFTEDFILAADRAVFEIFSFDFIKGDPSAVLSHNNSIVITESTGRKYFGEEEPVGRELTINNSIPVTVTGVIRDLPLNSSLKFTAIVPFAGVHGDAVNDTDNWAGNPLMTFVLLDAAADPAKVEEKLNGIFDKYSPRNPTINRALHLHPAAKMRLHDYQGGGTIIYVYIFAAIAALILVVACINYINLGMARAPARAREVAIRKVAGAAKRDLVRQFFMESAVHAFLALLVALILIEFTLPAFNRITGKELTLISLLRTGIMPAVIIAALLTVLISGGYPAVFLSAFKPARIIRGDVITGTGNSPARRIMVVFQFSISTALICSTMAISRQMDYMLGGNVGYDAANMIYIPMNENLKGKYESFRDELASNRNILGVTAGCQNPLAVTSTSQVSWEGMSSSDQIIMNWDFVDYGYIETFRMKVTRGRAFSREHASDLADACVINETAAAVMGMTEPLGKWIDTWFGRKIVIGVVADHHYESYRNEIKPFIMSLNPGWNNYVFARLDPGAAGPALDFIQEAWGRFCPDRMFEHATFASFQETLYGPERRLSLLMKYFAFLAVSISCLGLSAHVGVAVRRRTKEICIRKILGASVPGLLFMIKKELIILVAVSNLIAWPAAWLFIDMWLQNYAYRAPSSVWIYIASGLLALVVAVAVSSVQTIRAATARPARALKYE